VQEQTDDQQIRDLIATYCYPIDHQRGSEVPDRIFTEDAFDDHGVGLAQGRDELRAFFDTDKLLQLAEGTAHAISNQIVRVDGDTGRSQSYVTAWHWLQSRRDLGAEREADVVLVAIYDDTLRRTADGWRISKRYCRRIGPGPMSVGDLSNPSHAALAPFVKGMSSKLGVSPGADMLV
jgi:hypothetical protein